MPANLSPEYYQAETDFKSASTPEEKLECLQRMLSAIPKHKGTEKMQADLKRRISQFKEKQEQQSKKKGPSFRIKPEGAGQISLAGVPNCGKSTLLQALTNAEPEVADYPFSTREPIPGMAFYKDVQIQLVDLPPLSEEHCESFVFDNIRGSDGVVVVIDLEAAEPENDYKLIEQMLADKKIQLIPPDEEPSESELGVQSLRSIVLLNKKDVDSDGLLETMVRDMLSTPLPIYAVSAKTGVGLDSFTELLFQLLHIIRIYSKQPGKDADLDAPFTVPIGTNLTDFAATVHKDFAENLKSARLWGKSAKFDGQVIQKDHILEDMDIVELST